MNHQFKQCVRESFLLTEHGTDSQHDHLQILFHSLLLYESKVLEEKAYNIPVVFPQVFLPCDIQAVYQDRSASNGFQSSDHVQKRSLTTAAAPGDYHEFAFSNGTIEILKQCPVTIGFTQVPDFDR